MAAKRLHDGSENEEDQRDEKRMHRLPSFSTVIKEAVIMKQVQNVFMVLEPLLRRVVQEELQAGLVRSPLYIERASPETSSSPPPPSSPRPTWRLAFLNPPQLPIFTGSKIEDAHGSPLQLILVDADTGSPSQNVPQFLRVELVPIFGDFPHDGREECSSAGEFASGVVKERAGKRPLLTGDVTLTMRDGCATVGELQFTDNSSWLRCRKFRIGARVVPGSGYEGPRVAEAMTEAFKVRDHRGELYRKHYPPALGDDVWRLEKIGKEGAFHKKLTQSGVRTVQEFLQMLVVKPDVLRMIMGDGMTDRMWEVTTKHARQCEAGDKVYAYATGQPGGATVYVNSICQLVKIELAGVECVPQHLNRAQKAYVHQLLLEAFEQRGNLQEADILLHASRDLPLLQMYRKHYPPALGDDVWRLVKIGKEGAFHKKLTQNGVRTVQEFLQMLVVKPDVLRMIMGDGMTDRMWEATTTHARQCEAGDKVYAYAAGQPGGGAGATVYVNSICQLVKIELAGVECVPQHLNRAQKAYVHQLLLEAFEQRASLQEADHSNNDLPLLQNAAPAVPPPLPATPLWFQGNPDIDFQIIDELASQGNFAFKMFDE